MPSVVELLQLPTYRFFWDRIPHGGEALVLWASRLGPATPQLLAADPGHSSSGWREVAGGISGSGCAVSAHRSGSSIPRPTKRIQSASIAMSTPRTTPAPTR